MVASSMGLYLSDNREINMMMQGDQRGSIVYFVICFDRRSLIVRSGALYTAKLDAMGVVVDATVTLDCAITTRDCPSVVDAKCVVRNTV